MSSRLWLVTAAVILIAAAGASREEDQDKPGSAAKPILGVDRSYMDLTVSPCKDFYAYANGAFDKVPIPGEYAAYGVNQEIDERNFAILKEILENSARAGGPKGSVVQRVGDFYASGMDEAAIDREGLRPLAPWLNRIQAIASPQGTGCGHRPVAGPGPERRLPLRRADRRQGHHGHDRRLQPGRPRPAGARLLFSRGQRMPRKSAPPTWRTSPACSNWPGDAAGEGQGRRRFDHGLRDQAGESLAHARGSARSREELQQVQAEPRSPRSPPASTGTAISLRLRFPATKHNCWFASRSFSRPSAACSPPSRWRSGGITCAGISFRETANYLSKPFVDEHFSFYGKKLSGATELRPRWKRVLAAEDAAIGEDLGQLYVQKAFSPAAKARALAMVEFCQGGHAGAIRAANWMSQATKAAGLQEARHHAQQDGLSRQVARLQQARHRAAALRAQRAGRRRL